MDWFLEKHNSPKPKKKKNHKKQELENQNGSLLMEDIKSIIQNSTKENSEFRWLHQWIVPDINLTETLLINIKKGLLHNSFY